MTLKFIYNILLSLLLKGGLKKRELVDFLNSKGWSQFTSGFIVGGFGGASIAYILLKLVPAAAAVEVWAADPLLLGDYSKWKKENR